MENDLKSPKSRMRRRNVRRSSRLVRSTASKRCANQERIIQDLAKHFLADRMSAAGVSYIVKSRSRLRRWIWLAAVVMSISFMGYMTINVVLEYTGYPKMLIREAKLETKLFFPAVTLCPLNPILSHHIDETSVAPLLRLKEQLKNSTSIPTDREYRDKCYKDPLCQWSWFSETCTCEESPCLTEFCLPQNITHCACSSTFCRRNRYRTCTFGPPSTISNYSTSKGKRNCFCSTDLVYKSWTKPLMDQDESDLLSSISDSEVSEVVKLIRNAGTYDLVDIEEAMLPTVADLFEYGMNFDTLVISCSFEGSRCNRQNFTVLFHPKFGRCYMFNFLGTRVSSAETPIIVYNYGSSSGLQLILQIRKDFPVDLLNHEIGVRVVVHNPRDLPFVSEYGMNVRPKDMSAIEVTLNTIERLGPPWGQCVPAESAISFENIPFPYSVLGCEKECRHRHLTSRCKCTRRQYLRGSVLFKMTTAFNFCDIANVEQYSCMNNVIEDIEKRKISCNCQQPCQETMYKYTVSSSELNEQYYRAIKAIRTLDNDENGSLRITNATNENMMVGVKVYYNTFEVNSDKEIASYSWETLVANIGGNLGFFMGLTLVTFVEILEFLWDLMTAAFRKNNKFTPENELKQKISKINRVSSQDSHSIYLHNSSYKWND